MLNILRLYMGVGMKRRRKDFMYAKQIFVMIGYFFDMNEESEKDEFRLDKETVSNVLKEYLAVYNHEDDNQVFRERLMPPMTSWNNLCGGGNIENVAIKHDNRLISLSSDGLLDGNHGYSFDVNKHHKTDRLIDIISVLDGANEYFSTEMTSLEAFIREL